MIERLSNLNSLKCLKILSVGRNFLKSLAGVVSWDLGIGEEKQKKCSIG